MGKLQPLLEHHAVILEWIQKLYYEFHGQHKQPSLELYFPPTDGVIASTVWRRSVYTREFQIKAAQISRMLGWHLVPEGERPVYVPHKGAAPSSLKGALIVQHEQEKARVRKELSDDKDLQLAVLHCMELRRMTLKERFGDATDVEPVDISPSASGESNDAKADHTQEADRAEEKGDANEAGRTEEKGDADKADSTAETDHAQEVDHSREVVLAQCVDRAQETDHAEEANRPDETNDADEDDDIEIDITRGRSGSKVWSRLRVRLPFSRK